MPQSLKQLFVAFCLFALLALTRAQAADSADAVDAVDAVDAPPMTSFRIGLITIEPGEIYWQRFGHNAILVENLIDGDARVYNFGMFDFGQKNFLLNFVRGRMLYRLGVNRLPSELAMYAAERRGVTLDRLDLSADQAYAVAEMLAQNALPENAEYRYDYFQDNCSTRVRDVFDRVLSGQARAELLGRSQGRTYRQLALTHAEAEPWLAIGIDLGLGRHADRPLNFWQEAFIPSALAQFARELKNPETERALVRESVELVPARGQPPHTTLAVAPTWLMLALSLLLGLALFWASQHARSGWRRLAAVGAILLHLGAGLVGLGLLALMFGTDHSIARWNENALLFFPTLWLLIPALWRMQRTEEPGGKILATLGFLLAIVALGLKLDSGAQSNAVWLAAMLPWHALVWLRLARPFR